MDDNQDNAQKNDPDKKAKKTFRDHSKAIITSTESIGKHVADLEKAGVAQGAQTDILNRLKAETAQLHLSVNNAHNVPDDEDEVENTGGAGDTSAVDPNKSKAA